jgi:hypothetical protein
MIKTGRRRIDMPFYLVKYTKGKNNEYVYPVSLAGVVWRTNISNHIEMVMVGETDDEVSVDGRDVVALEPAEAERLIEKYCMERPAAPVPG